MKQTEKKGRESAEEREGRVWLAPEMYHARGIRQNRTWWRWVGLAGVRGDLGGQGGQVGGGGNFVYQFPLPDGVQMNQGRHNLRYEDNDEEEMDLNEV